MKKQVFSRRSIDDIEQTLQARAPMPFPKSGRSRGRSVKKNDESNPHRGHNGHGGNSDIGGGKLEVGVPRAMKSAK